MRRLPIYFFVNVSESMVGTPIEQVQDGMAAIINELRTDPEALENACVGDSLYWQSKIPISDFMESLSL